MVTTPLNPLVGEAPIAPGSLPDIIDSAPGTLTIFSRLELFHGYMGVFVAAFLVTMIATPFMRRLALANGIIDQPSDPRKVHRIPVAYLGGVAVFLGLLAGVGYSYAAYTTFPLTGAHEVQQSPVPFSVLLGMMLIMLAGLLDDVVGVSPRIKISMQLIAAAALAISDVGVKVASGVLRPLGRLIGNESLFYTIDINPPIWLLDTIGVADPTIVIPINIIYWVGTAIIAVFILGSCNASNLIDGLDGLCSGVTAIVAGGLLLLALGMASSFDGPLDSARIVLCLALLGACLGFLPHNFNPASIFLGDCGSMLLGYMAIVIILMLGDTGKTQFVIAGLLIYSVPIIDTTLAIVRRKMQRKSIGDADDQHLHHMLKRSLGVKGAVFSLYGMTFAFVGLGVLLSLGRARVAYAIALVLASYIGVTAVKIARRKIIEEQAAAAGGKLAKRLSVSRKTTNGKHRPEKQRAAEQPPRPRESAEDPAHHTV